MESDNKNELKTELKTILSQIKEFIIKDKWNKNDESHISLWEKMVKIAKELHALVKPKHHEYMIKNRGCSPDDPEFYNHIHPVEDLLAFMDNPNANDDPEDKTINHDFELKIFSRRWGGNDTYRIKRILSGWYIENISISGNCDKAGKPFLFENLRQDSVNYPEALPEYLEWLWEQAAEQGMNHEQVQKSLNQLGEWIKKCEDLTPQGIWEAYG